MKAHWDILLLGAGLLTVFGPPLLAIFLLRRYRRWGVLKLVGAGLGVMILVNGSVALIMAPGQHRQEREFLETKLLPLADYVVSFRDAHSRLPTHDEFHAWADHEYPNQAISYYDRKPSFCWKWGKSGSDFLVGRWEGEWMEYHRFSDGKDFSGPVGD